MRVEDTRAKQPKWKTAASQEAAIQRCMQQMPASMVHDAQSCDTIRHRPDRDNTPHYKAAQVLNCSSSCTIMGGDVESGQGLRSPAQAGLRVGLAPHAAVAHLPAWMHSTPCSLACGNHVCLAGNSPYNHSELATDDGGPWPAWRCVLRLEGKGRAGRQGQSQPTHAMHNDHQRHVCWPIGRLCGSDLSIAHKKQDRLAVLEP